MFCPGVHTSYIFSRYVFEIVKAFLTFVDIYRIPEHKRACILWSNISACSCFQKQSASYSH